MSEALRSSWALVCGWKYLRQESSNTSKTGKKQPAGLQKSSLTDSDLGPWWLQLKYFSQEHSYIERQITAQELSGSLYSWAAQKILGSCLEIYEQFVNEIILPTALCICKVFWPDCNNWHQVQREQKYLSPALWGRGLSRALPNRKETFPYWAGCHIRTLVKTSHFLSAFQWKSAK